MEWLVENGEVKISNLSQELMLGGGKRKKGKTVQLSQKF